MDENKEESSLNTNSPIPEGLASPQTPEMPSQPSTAVNISQPEIKNTADDLPPAAAPYAPPVTSTPPPAQPESIKHNVSAGTIILQWLTYALWGWAVLALAFLSTGVLLYYINKADTSTFDEYSMAAVIILLPAAFICDLFYSKKEESKKTGASQIIMVIHAVLFALLAIGTLIFAAFSIVTFLVSSGTKTDTAVEIFSSLVIFIYYCATLIRTLNPARLSITRKVFRIFMVVSVIIFIFLTIFGPLTHVNSAKNDTLIDNNISDVSTNIDTYASSNNRLPSDYQQLNLTGDDLVLFQKNLASYIPGSQVRQTSQYSDTSLQNSNFTYQLCVHYKFATTNYVGGNQSTASSYPDTTKHSSGYYCYNLTTI